MIFHYAWISKSPEKYTYSGQLRFELAQLWRKSHRGEEQLAETNKKNNFKNMSCIVDGNGWFKNPWLAERSQVTTRWGKKSPTLTMGMTI